MTSSPRGISERSSWTDNAAARCAGCSRCCGSAWRRRRAPTRWRYREVVSPALAAGARVLADVVPARGIEPAAALHALAGPGSVLLSRERAAGRTSRRGRLRCSRGAIRPARWRRRAPCSTGSPPTSRRARRRSRRPARLARLRPRPCARAIPQVARDDLALPACNSRRSTRCTHSTASAASCGSSRAPNASCGACATVSTACGRWPPSAPGDESAACPRPTTAPAWNACSTTSARRRLRGQLHAAARGELFQRPGSLCTAARACPCRTTLPGRRRLAARGRDARDVPARRRRRALRDAADQGHAAAR